MWHIARKDIRRMALPVAVWLAFMLLSAIWFAVSAGTEMVVTAEDVNNWVGGTRVAVGLLAVVQGVICYFLIGAMVVEEPLVGSSAFWMTRPISNTARTVSTVTAALLLFVVVPAAVLLPVWCIGGFSAGEIATAIKGLLETQVGLVLLATAVAGMSRNLAQFLFFSVGLLVAFMLCLSPLLDTSGAGFQEFNVRVSRTLLIAGAIWPVAAVVFVHQFLTRRVRRTWLLVGIAVAAGFAVRLVWPWESGDVFSWNRWVYALGGRPDNRINDGIVIEAETAENHGWQHWPNALRVSTSAPGDLLIPLEGSADAIVGGVSEPIARFKLAGPSPADVAQLALRRPLRTAHWSLPGVDHAITPEAVRNANSIRVRIAGNTGKLLGIDTIPFTRSEIRTGSRLTRVLPAGTEDNGAASVLLEERDAFTSGNLFHSISIGRSPLSFQHRDIFALVNGVTHETRVLRCEDLGAVEFESMIVGYRQIIVPSELRAGSWQSASIIRIRIELGRRFYSTRDIAFPVKML